MRDYPHEPNAYGDRYASFFRALSPSVGKTKTPIRVSHVGPSFVCAGVESWLRTLVSHSDPSSITFVKNVVTEEYAVDFGLLQKLGVPFEIGDVEPVREVAWESDVVIVWGSVNPSHLRPQGSTSRVVFVAHGMGEGTRRALSVCAPVVDHVVAVSPIVKETLKSDLPTTVILNGVDQAHIACRDSRENVRRRLGFTDDDFVVGYVGRFSPEKQAHLMIDAVNQLEAHSKALLVGWGPLRYALMDQCNAQLPGRFAFADSRAYMGDFYQVMDALCMPSAEEGFGLVVSEAMFHGVPVISTKVGIAEAVVEDRVNGLICQADAAHIAGLLRELQRHPDWAAGLGFEGKRTVEQYCLGLDMARQYEQLLRSLVQGFDA